MANNSCVTQEDLLSFYNTYVKPYINAESGGHEIKNDGDVTTLEQRELMTFKSPIFAADNSSTQSTDIDVDTDADLSSFPIPQGEAGTRGVPVGTVINFFGDSAPDGYLACDGAEYNKADYTALSAHLATLSTASQYAGSTSDKFKVPDLRGEFLRGTGTNGHSGQGSGSNVGIHQDATTMLALGLETSGAYGLARSGDLTASEYPTNADSYSGLSGNKKRTVSSTSTTMSSTGRSSMTARPTNTSVMYCIKY